MTRGRRIYNLFPLLAGPVRDWPTHLAELDWQDGPRDRMQGYFTKVVRHYAGLGFRGFRCDAAYKIPAEIWRALIGAGREVEPMAFFCAETLGCRLDEIAALEGAGF